ncbi:hypothetical protein DMENIID0001_150660 [Sergentomyia squamirostris]
MDSTENCDPDGSEQCPVRRNVKKSSETDNFSRYPERVFWSGKFPLLKVSDSAAITDRDLNAMSVASLYDHEDQDTKEMESEK